MKASRTDATGSEVGVSGLRSAPPTSGLPGLKIFALACLALFSSLNFMGTAQAADDGMNGDVNIPDANLRRVIEQSLGKAEGEEITEDEMLRLPFYFELSELGIADLTGLEFATNVSWLYANDNRISDLGPLAGLTRLTQLQLSGNAISDIAPLSELTNLRKLYLENNDIEDIAPLSELTSLIWLYLSDNEISDIGPLAESALTYLFGVYLAGNEISDIGSLAGSTLPRLYLLDLSGNAIADIGPVSGLTTLTELSLTDNQVVDIGPLVGLANLQVLRLGGNEIADVTALEGLTGLNFLELYDNEISDLEPLVSNRGLSYVDRLYLTCCPRGLERAAGTPNPLSDQSVNEHVPALRERQVVLYLDAEDFVEVDVPDVSLRGALGLILRIPLGEAVTQAEMDALVSFTRHEGGIADLTGLQAASRLRSLTLSGHRIVDITPLREMVGLTGLDLSDNEIVDIEALSGLTGLAVLRLDDNAITNVSTLAGLTMLHTLSLYGNSVVDIGALAGLTRLTTLTLSDNAIVDIGALEGLTSLTGLYLYGNAIMDISALAALTNLNYLSLSDNAITDISALSALTNLISLDILDNEIADISALSGLTKLGLLLLSGNAITDVSALSGLTNLTHLYLAENRITDISALSGLTNLFDLDLAYNEISDLGALSALNNLHTLDLAGNAISSVEPLSGLTSLDTLDLAYNNIMDIGPLLGLSDSLYTLDLDGNPLSDESASTHIQTLREAYREVYWLAARSVPLHMVGHFPPAWDISRQGFVRIINHSPDAGEVRIRPIDYAGYRYEELILSIDPSETVHLNSDDFQMGNADKGLTGSVDFDFGYRGIQDAWRLDFASDLDIEVLSYIRTSDGFLTAMHDFAPATENRHHVAIFNPGSNSEQVSYLRLINPGPEDVEVSIRGIDDKGESPGSEVSLSVDAHATRTLTAAELEAGDDDDRQGALGDGAGKWWLTVESEQPLLVMSLMSSPTGHLTNLSTVPTQSEDGSIVVPLFPAANDETGRMGFVRVINHSADAGEVRIQAFDNTEREYEPTTLAIGANETKHFNSDDLEQGNPIKGLSAGIGAGMGSWWLDLSSELDIEVLAYIRTNDGFLTAMHDAVRASGQRHRAAIFNPGSNANQVSSLRIINPDATAAEVIIRGIDDHGESPGTDVQVSVPAAAARSYTAAELEAGGGDLQGALEDGAGKWQLIVESEQPVMVLSLLNSPTGHLTNLSTDRGRGASD